MKWEAIAKIQSGLHRGRALSSLTVDGVPQDISPLERWANDVQRREPWWKRLVSFRRNLNREVDEIMRGDRKAFSNETFAIL